MGDSNYPIIVTTDKVFHSQGNQKCKRATHFRYTYEVLPTCSVKFSTYSILKIYYATSKMLFIAQELSFSKRPRAIFRIMRKNSIEIEATDWSGSKLNSSFLILLILKVITHFSFDLQFFFVFHRLLLEPFAQVLDSHLYHSYFSELKILRSATCKSVLTNTFFLTRTKTWIMISLKIKKDSEFSNWVGLPQNAASISK